MLQMRVGNPEKCGKSVEFDQKPVPDKSWKSILRLISNMFLVTLHWFPAFPQIFGCHLQHKSWPNSFWENKSMFKVGEFCGVEMLHELANPYLIRQISLEVNQSWVDVLEIQICSDSLIHGYPYNVKMCMPIRPIHQACLIRVWKNCNQSISSFECHDVYGNWAGNQSAVNQIWPIWSIRAYILAPPPYSKTCGYVSAARAWLLTKASEIKQPLLVRGRANLCLILPNGVFNIWLTKRTKGP